MLPFAVIFNRFTNTLLLVCYFVCAQRDVTAMVIPSLYFDDNVKQRQFIIYYKDLKCTD